jgi:hypothetical protein
MVTLEAELASLTTFKVNANQLLRRITRFLRESAFLKDSPALLRTLVPSEYNRPSNPRLF